MTADLSRRPVTTRRDFLDAIRALSAEDRAERALSLGLPAYAFEGPTIARLVRHIVFLTPDACWPWVGPRQGSGYGVFGFAKTSRGPHRLVYVLAVAPLADRSLKILHSCDVPRCCNPAHLRPGTQAENMKEAHARGRHPGAGHGTSQAIRERIPEFVYRRLVVNGGDRAEAFEWFAVIFGISPDYVGTLYDRARRAALAAVPDQTTPTPLSDEEDRAA